MRVFLISVFLLCAQLLSAQQEDSLRLSNACLHYYTYGEGETVLILSGGPGLASHQEDDVAIALSKDYKAILLDQRGTGKSWTKPLDSTTINLQVAVNDIESLRVHLKIKQLIIYGHSWGAMLATAYTAHYPDNVKKLILVGGGELSPALSDIVNRNIDLRFQLSDTTAYYHWTDSTVIAQDSAHANYELRKMTISLLIYDQSRLDSFMIQVSRGAMNKDVNRWMWKSISSNKEDWAAMTRKKYKGETLIIFGWQDPIGLTTLSSYQYAFPTAQTVGIDECGHLPSVEQPAIFFPALFAFLKE